MAFRGVWTKGAAALAISMALAAGGASAQAPTKLTTPAEALGGHSPGDDYFLANYEQLAAYWRTLASQSPRAKLVSIGKTAFGRDQLMLIVSTPENLARLDRWRDIAHRLGDGRIPETEAKALAREGKAIVWMDAGLHANETVTAQTHIQLAYDLLSAQDEETLRFLNDDIVLLPIANPDGMSLVADWYMRKSKPEDRRNADLPVLYQKYIGHDNNRDFYASNQPETTNMNRALWRDWRPLMVYNEHQTGPLGTVVFIPPFRDPFNYNYDPLVITQTDSLAMHMHNRLIAHDMPGSTMRSGAPYSTWFNGGLRTVSYFHNTLGILTEIIGDPTPYNLPLVPKNQLAREDLPMPVAPGVFHFKQSVDYMRQMDRAVMDYASRNRELLLMNSWVMGRNSVRRGSQDSWTVTPKRVAALQEAAKGTKPPVEGEVYAGMTGYDGRDTVDSKFYASVLHDPAKRDARAYVIPADQADLPTAVRFLNSLMNTGVEVQRATAPFSAGGKSYPAGSFVVRADQAFRPHVLDMFEPQDHPQDFAYPGGPPNRPYDITGYALALQMGVKFDRVLETLDAPLAPVPDVMAAPPAGRIVGSGGAGWLIDHAPNNGFILTNRLMKAGQKAFWLEGAARAGGRDLAPGALWIPATGASRAEVLRATRDLGLTAYATGSAPGGGRVALKPVRIGLVDVYGGSMPSGWTRWLLEQFEFPYELVFPARLNAGNLRKDYDVLLFPSGTVPAPGVGRGEFGGRPQPKPEDIPAEHRAKLGRITIAETVPQVAAFAREGGTVAAVGSSSVIGNELGLPVQNALVEAGPDGKPKPLPGTKFYIPGSLLWADVDTAQPLAWGLPPRMDVFFDASPAFKLGAGATPVAGYKGADVLHAGWAWGQKALDGTTAVAQADLGRGKVFLFGPEVTMRGQPALSFKFLFNALYLGPATAR